jgi:CheY-like chemotaxis protein
MSANTSAADRERCLRAGMNDQVTKPISRESVAAALAGLGLLVAVPPAS